MLSVRDTYHCEAIFPKVRLVALRDSPNPAFRNTSQALVDVGSFLSVACTSLQSDFSSIVSDFRIR